ncbi:MAG: fibronectin type III domain-containing protein, partial [Mycobacteriales bacterium]
NTPALTIDAGPTITSVSPSSAAAGTSKTITISGLHYDSPSQSDPFAKPTVQFSIPPTGGAARQADSSVSVGTVTVTKANGVTTTSDTVSFPLSVSSTAPPGLRDIVLTNPSDNGSVLCAGCFGVDNLTVSPTSGANTGAKTIALTGPGVVAGSSAKLVRAGDPAIQPAINGSSPSVSGTTLTAQFDLTDAAPGPYSAIVTAPNGSTSSCSSCFTVTGSTPSITSISPAAGGQGATNLPITVTGNNFSRGQQLAITDVSVHDVLFVSRTTLTAKVDIAPDAPTGAKDAKATNADGVASGTKTGAFTVSPPPKPTSASPASYGQGAKGVKITVTGPGIADGAKVSFGPGITVTGVAVTQGTVIPIVAPDPDDTLEATVTIDETAPANQRDVVVTNPDGGVGTLAKGFSVNFGPKVTGITPGFLEPNAVDKPVTIAGSNFSTTSGKTAVPTAPGITFKDVVVAADGNSMTAKASVDSGTAKGLKNVVVTNPTDSGAGTCPGCLAVATPPAPPTGVSVVSTGSSSITAKWTAPSDNGGAPITSYVVSAKDSTGKAVGTAGTTSGSATQGTVTGLKPSTLYQVLVVARNVAGDSNPGSAGARTTGTTSGGTTLLTSGHSPSLTTTGQRMNLSGRLIQVSTGTGISGATVELALVPDIGSATFPKVVTNSSGVWSYNFAPVYSHTIKTLYRGDSSHDATQAPSYRMGVSTKVTVTSPANGSRSSVRSPLVVTGTTTPNKGGNLITLYRWNGSIWAAVQNVRVASNGTYRFTVNFSRGPWTLKVGIGRTTGNFVGYSPAFGVYRA